MISLTALMAGSTGAGAMAPLLDAVGWRQWGPYARPWAVFAGFGMFQVFLSYLVCTPLETLRPLVRWQQRQPMAADITYTFVVRLVIFPLVAFFEYDAARGLLDGFFSAHGIADWSALGWLSAATGAPVLGFVAGLVVLDFSDYWRHRLSHRFAWWYGIHSLHHAELQMTFWSDDRSHVLEDVITYAWLIAVALALGMPSHQFPFVILAFRLVGSVAHANTRFGYGWLGERLLISPQFHRAHHCPEIAGFRSCNFGTVFPVWDMLFGTADFSHRAVHTGDPGADSLLASGNWWQQQASGFRRMVKLARRHRA
ncbi:sterol desaturase family protein [Cupriavidus sp. 30B13]|uniref:sterol desaturase family protein n=1 Tax=Cupriavidus sp. 30B13 TaxID=3384241 RepID=UPI003B9055FA